MEIQERFARTILNGFESYFADFRNITLAAWSRFQNADWHGIQRDSARRIDIYKEKTTSIYAFVELIAGDLLHNFEFWREAKAVYSELIADHDNFEIAETFFNSVYCAVFKHRKIRNEYAFVFSPRGDMPPADVKQVYRTYRLDGPLESLLDALLRDYAFSIPYEDRRRDIANIVAVFDSYLAARFDFGGPGVEFQVLEHHFFRNKGAYIVGRIVAASGCMPFVLPILHNEAGAVYVDTVLFGADKVSVLFSFTRSYFLVDARIPSQYVLFLQQLMPAKPISEIYSAMGYNKHGKTYYHRCAYRHMQKTSDKFMLAPGIKGMVMTVFTMPSYDFVFKIIKDRFTPPKEMTREQVKAKYSLVKRWDRVGRMADTQEFTNLAFARERFSDELMEELHKVAPSMIEEHGKALVIKHVYVERRMTPLNLYLQDATDEQLVDVMDEYGNAIKQLAAANIFPGDMLLKNFGVTRHGRVVFYDYDELALLTECRFRRIPPSRGYDDDLAAEPWFHVNKGDIFPEEFPRFLGLPPALLAVFMAHHGDLCDAAFWRETQEGLRRGELFHIFPYAADLRLRPESRGDDG